MYFSCFIRKNIVSLWRQTIKTLYKMNKRLKIIAIAISVVFAMVIYQGTIGFVQGFRIGFNEGREYGRNEKIGALVTRMFHLSLKPEEGPYTFPTTTLPATTLFQLPVNAEIGKMKIQVTYDREQVPKRLLIAENLAMLFLFFSLYAFVLIPVQTFRIVRSITRNKIFDFANIKRLRQIGYALLVVYVLHLVMNYFDYKIASYVVQVEGYLLRMSWGDITLLLLGFVVLMFAEVLKISVPLKEEQDLTV